MLVNGKEVGTYGRGHLGGRIRVSTTWVGRKHLGRSGVMLSIERWRANRRMHWSKSRFTDNRT